MNIGIYGCGYVGQAIAAFWKKRGHHISATTRRRERVPFLESLVDKVYLLEGEGLASFLSKQEALLISVAPDKFSDYTSTYLHTAQQIAHFLPQCPIKNIVYTSSTSVYGDFQGRWVDEDASITPTSENQKILYETEQELLRCQSSQVDICILRLGEIYGPNRKIEDRLRKMQYQTFAGSGASFTNLIHLTDLLNAIDFVLQNRLQGIYNLCSDYHLPRKEFYDKLCQNEGLSPIQWDSTRTSSHQGNKKVSNQKIKKSGFSFTHPLYF